MVMPVNQICPICHRPFLGTDAIGHPCIDCEVSEKLKKQKFDYKKIVTDYLDLCDELRIIAQKFGNAMLDWNCVVSNIQVDKDMFFRFSYESSTPGIRFYGRLPVSLMERPESDLLEIIERDKVKAKEERDKNTCKTCGHNKLYLGHYYC